MQQNIQNYGIHPKHAGKKKPSLEISQTLGIHLPRTYLNKPLLARIFGKQETMGFPGQIKKSPFLQQASVQFLWISALQK